MPKRRSPTSWTRRSSLPPSPRSRRRRASPTGYMMEKITQALGLRLQAGTHEGARVTTLTVEANEETGSGAHVHSRKTWWRRWTTRAPRSVSGGGPPVPAPSGAGDAIRIEVKPKNFGRIAAQTARQVIIQGIREAEQGHDL
ncbi:MAG: NusA N-terminal domain-containing protein [Flavonifractor plautii]